MTPLSSRQLLRVLLTTGGAALLGCGEPVGPGAGALAGRWEADAEPLRPSGTYHRSLTFRAGGRYEAAWRMTGVYAGQPAGQLSAYGRTVGRYHIDGDRLVVQADSLVTWDRFYGATSPERVEAPPRGGAFPDSDTRFAVAGDLLTLRYLSYSADAPVPTVAVYRRAR